jgi:hypothetical protein
MFALESLGPAKPLPTRGQTSRCTEGSVSTREQLALGSSLTPCVRIPEGWKPVECGSAQECEDGGSFKRQDRSHNYGRQIVGSLEP